MMFKKKFFLVLFLLAGAFSSCKKEGYDRDKQLAIDDTLIKEFITKNNIPAIKDKSGVYYQIIKQGNGSVNVTSTTLIKVTYEGRLLNGNIFDKNSAGKTFSLNDLIEGWQIGLPKIRSGGTIRLIVPSTLGYGNQSQGDIPANSVLDFTIDLIDAK